MSRSAYALFIGAALAVILTGLVYGWMLYAMEPAGEFSVVNHPWQPHLLHLHILAGPVLVFMLGYFLAGHVRPFMTGGIREGRRTGRLMWWAAPIMAASAYLIQAGVDPDWRTAWVVVHVASSLVWTAAFAAHIVIHRSLRRSAAGR